MKPVQEIRCEQCNKFWGLAGPVCVYKSPPCTGRFKGEKCKFITEYYRNDGSVPIEFLFKPSKTGIIEPQIQVRKPKDS